MSARPRSRKTQAGRALPARVRAREVAAHVARAPARRASRRTPRAARSRRRNGPRGRAGARDAHAAEHRADGRPPAGGRRSRCRCGARGHAFATARPGAARPSARSSGVVILRLRGEPATARHRPAQALDRHRLVGEHVTPSRSRRVVAPRAGARRRKPCGVCAAASSARSSGLPHACRPRTRLMVSTSGQHGDGRPRLERGRATTASMRAALDQRPRRVVHEHDAVEAVGQRGQSRAHRVLAPSRRPPPPPSPCAAARAARARRAARRAGTTATIALHRGRGLEGVARARRRSGSPARARNALGRPAPMRSPRPAATRMAMLLGDTVGELIRARRAGQSSLGHDAGTLRTARGARDDAARPSGFGLRGRAAASGSTAAPRTRWSRRASRALLEPGRARARGGPRPPRRRWRSVSSSAADAVGELVGVHRAAEAHGQPVEREHVGQGQRVRARRARPRGSPRRAPPAPPRTPRRARRAGRG